MGDGLQVLDVLTSGDEFRVSLMFTIVESPECFRFGYSNLIFGDPSVDVDWTGYKMISIPLTKRFGVGRNPRWATS